ncbi:MAG TPA: hypothetical protein VII26_01545 [Candidatus Limnocylindria bacterium]
MGDADGLIEGAALVVAALDWLGTLLAEGEGVAVHAARTRIKATGAESAVRLVMSGTVAHQGTVARGTIHLEE